MVIAIARIQFPWIRDNVLLKPQVGIDGKFLSKRKLGHHYVDLLGMGRSGIVSSNPTIAVRGFSLRGKGNEMPKRFNALSSPLVSSMESEGTISTSAPLNDPTLEGRLETIIFNCRFLTLMAVVGSLSGSVLCFLKGGAYVFESFREWFCFCLRNRGTGKVILLLVEALDVYLMGTVMLIFGMGLYGLFINNLEVIAENCNGQASETICGSSLFGLFKLQERPTWLKTNSLEELKAKLGHVIVMILLVGMFDKSKKIPINSALDLVCFSASILFSSGCLYLLSKLKSDH
ncbi:uncharacterized protein LOC131073425 [Cryptomeria japonica]|uniref:uncharacterized protein LOC131073425 n=1 Tax=Cryptomeria japonica TaxID=3369 RepID=UPI0025AB5EFF|nr:uncharacterized protein LOC131073425 [Cryptomeria japonica]